MSSPTPANITATGITATPSTSPCTEGICTVTIYVTWTNTGGISGSFIPNITIDNIPITPAPFISESLTPGTSVSHTFIISDFAAGEHTIYPYPN